MLGAGVIEIVNDHCPLAGTIGSQLDLDVVIVHRIGAVIAFRTVAGAVDQGVIVKIRKWDFLEAV